MQHKEPKALLYVLQRVLRGDTRVDGIRTRSNMEGKMSAVAQHDTAQQHIASPTFK